MILFCLILIKLEQFEKVVHDSMLFYFFGKLGQDVVNLNQLHP